MYKAVLQYIASDMDGVVFMLPLNKLHQAVSQAGEEGLFDKLQAVYDQVPETECDKCATCCTVPQPAYVVEFLNMFRYVNNRMPEAWPDLIANAVRYYFLELVDVNQRCPFLGSDNDCRVYEVRPFTCRLYGLLGNSVNNAEMLGNMQKLADKYRQEHGIELPEDIVRFELPRCEKVRVVNQKGKKPQDLVQLLAADIGQLETFFVPPTVVDSQYTFVPYVNHLVMSVVSEGARYRRPRVMKDFLETGRSELLEGYVEKFKNITF